jgi:shikimate dehydrogenase
MSQGKVILGLIGFPLEHSQSPAWFNDKFIRTGITDSEYRLFPLTSIEQFLPLLRSNPDLSGLNVTIPFKEKIIAYTDELDETAKSVGAVNTIKITRHNGVIHTKGFNTDSPGFYQTLTSHIPSGPALILGTGGAAKAVAHALSLKKIPFFFVSRNTTGDGIVRYSDLTSELLSRHLLIINTTPLGMYPESGKCPPIPYQFLSGNHFLYDLVYNPEETEFMRRGKMIRARTMNGLQMLYNQAEISFNIFFDIG